MAKDTKTVRVRMLLDASVEGATYKCNDVVELPESVAKEAIARGDADAAASAVAYALSEGAEVRRHGEPEPDTVETK
jgi:hypothetical protein